MKETREVIAFQNEEAQRLDHFLVSQFPEHSRSFLQSLIKTGHVSINQQVVNKTGYKLDKPANIEIVFPPPEPSGLIPENIPLDIIFEDKKPYCLE